MTAESFRLIIDHRTGAAKREAARVELWDAIGSGEPWTSALLVLSEAEVEGGQATATSTLGAVVQALRAQTRPTDATFCD